MRWVVLPLETMAKQDPQSADQLLAIATPHAFQFPEQVLDVDVLETTLSEQLRCPLRPGIDIVLIKTGRAHAVYTMVSLYWMQCRLLPIRNDMLLAEAPDQIDTRLIQSLVSQSIGHSSCCNLASAV